MSPRTPFLVGLVLLSAVGGMSFFIAHTNKDLYDEASTYPLAADFTDASGIRTKTRVQIGGIDVGKIAAIAHVRGADGRLRARVTLRIAKEFDLFADAEVRKVAESLLGDFRLELDPGTPSQPKLQPGAMIGHVHSLSDLDEIKSQVLQVSRNVNHVTESFAKVLSGAHGEGSLQGIVSNLEKSMAAIAQTTQALRHTVVGNDRVLNDIIHHVGEVSASLAKITRRGGDVPKLAHHLASLSAKLDHVADTVENFISGAGKGTEGEEEGQNATNLRATLSNLNGSLAHLSSVSKKIDEGQGTVGRVINDPGIVDRLESTLDSAGDLIGSIASIETLVELRSEYDVPLNGTNLQIQPAIKNTLGLRIRSKPDKFYILEAVSDPRGRQTRTVTTAQVGSDTITTDETRIGYNELKFSAQFAKRFYFATLRFGITENTGGLGIDLHALNNRAEMRLDAYDFDRRSPGNNRPIFPRLKVTSIVELANHLHMQLGIDDPFNVDLRVWFLGGVLRFTDEDLKALLTVAPKP